MPRPGGESDKLGNHYEGAWTVFHVLQVLAGRAESITVEPLGEIGEGIEFTVHRPTAVEAHQVKRQLGSANEWRLSDLRSRGVLDSARGHVAAGREFHFVSTVPARDLDELASRARNSPDLQTFVDTLPSAGREVKAGFEYLSSAAYDAAQVAWDTLRGTHVHWPGHRDLRNLNAALAGLLLTGAPPLAAAVSLGDLIYENLSVPLDSPSIVDRLSTYELSLSQIIGTESVAQRVRETLTNWKSSIERELLNPAIPRPEAETIFQSIDSGRIVFAVGPGGAGKSAVLHEVVSYAESTNWAVIGFRLDRLEPFSSSYELGSRFGLDVSPVSALAALAQDRPSLLVIDQLDAVSKASGRMPQVFDAVNDLVREASAFPRMRVILACRSFDLENDDRVRTLVKVHKAEEHKLEALSTGQLADALVGMNVQASSLSAKQLDLLRLPLHLKLFESISDQPGGFAFTTTNELFDAYWDRKRRDCQGRRPGVRFGDVIGAVADGMSARQSLTIPTRVLDDDELASDADVLASEYVLVKTGRQVAFFHESFFDYAFARNWLRGDQTLVEFLVTTEQELFRRGQVRQILTFLRDDDLERFIVEIEELLREDGIRFHLKDVALGLLRALATPSPAEWHMVERLLQAGLPFEDRLHLSIRVLPWFDRMDAEGVFERWLGSDSRSDERAAIEAMLGGVKDRPDRLAEILAPHATRAGDYPNWLRWIARFADVHTSRRLFDLLLDSVRRGEYDGRERELGISVYGLGSDQPQWAAELLGAYLGDRPNAFELDESGKVKALEQRETAYINMTTAAAANAPRVFAEAMVPYVLRVMTLTSLQRADGRLIDQHFVHGDWPPPYHDLEHAVGAGLADALRRLVVGEPEAARPLLEQLAAAPYYAAHWFAFEGIAAGGVTFADYGASLLLHGDHGLYVTDSSTVRKTIHAIGPHIPQETFSALEQAIIEARPSWERRPPLGHFSFTLLAAMPEERLSETGRRRLGELRRLFGQDEPVVGRGVIEPTIGSPIPRESAARMSDDQWIRAMARHNADQSDWTTMRGGALELSDVLYEEVKDDPARFARLALRLPSTIHTAYLRAILRGLGDTEVAVDSETVFEAVRYLSAFADTDNMFPWLGWPLRRHLTEVPDDVVRLLVDVALRRDAEQEDEAESRNRDLSDAGERDLLTDGINTTVGHVVQVLGDVLVHDADGTRTAIVAPVLSQLASAPSLAIRACTAHLIAACLRHARPEAVAAFLELIRADDRLLSTRTVVNLIVYVGFGDPDLVDSVIRRMLTSAYAPTRKAGGSLAAFAGLQLGLGELLTAARESGDAEVRKGAAKVCAARLGNTANADLARDALHQFFEDPDDGVRGAAAEVAGHLRGNGLRPFESTLIALINSAAFDDATAQLLITLEQAPDRVDDLIIACCQRFVQVHGLALADMSTRAAADAHHVSQLLMQAYAQASDAPARRTVLDLIDALLMFGAFGLADLINALDRS